MPKKTTFCKIIIVLYALLGGSVFNAKFAFASNGTLTEWDQHQRWSGPVTNIHPIGLNVWEGHWQNDHNEGRTLIITIDDVNEQIDILEKEPNQHWIGPYRKNGNNYLASGTEASGRYDFSANLTLE